MNEFFTEDRVATRIVARIDELFSIDAEARSANLDHAARHALRLQRARSLLDLLKPQMEAIQAEVLPASALGKAAQYTLALWPKLTRFLEYPELAYGLDIRTVESLWNLSISAM